MAPWILPAFVTGLVGSLHCLGMCGPLVLGLHGSGGGTGGRVAYHVARAGAYALLGALLGAVGEGLALAGWQRGLSIGAGLLILLLAARAGWLERAQGWLSGVAARGLAPGLRRARQRGGWSGQALAGFLNGWLPCGMVYVALAASTATGSAAAGAGFMALFGLGTLPAMLGVSLGGRFLGQRLRGRLQPVLRGWMLVLGLLLVLRGVDLGIPYLSPQLPDAVATEVEEAHCCSRPSAE